MSDDMIEHVAHAICPYADGEDPCNKCSLSERGPHGGVRGCILSATNAAHAAISTMRKPTEALYRAAHDVDPHRTRREFDEEWTRYIDALE